MRHFRQAIRSVFMSLALVSLLLTPRPSPTLYAEAAVTLTVRSSGDGAADARNCPGANCRLRDAIAKASPGDTINFSLTYPVTLTLTSGELIVDKALTINGPGAANLAVSAGGAARVFNLVTEGAVTLTGLTIRDGWTNNGGGIYATGPLTLNEVNLINNQVSDDGGGVYALKTLRITGGRIENNRSTGSSGVGGGVHAWDPLEMINVTVLSNAANMGGGVEAADSMTVSGCLFQANHAGFAGGAIDAKSVTIRDSRFIRNTAQVGGGVHIVESSRGNSQVVNTLLAGNLATQGAALYLHRSSMGGGQAALVHTTIVDPNMNSGSAIYVGKGQVTISNTLVASYTVGLAAESKAKVLQDYNLLFHAPAGSGVTGGAHNITDAPAFINPAGDDFHLSKTSAAIDMGTNAGVATDLDGNARPQGRGYDIGAYEAPTLPAPLVQPASSPNPSLYGQSVTLTATVQAATARQGAPTGSVTFYADGHSLGTAALSAQTAALTTGALMAGTRVITVAYGGDGSFASNASDPFSQTVNYALDIHIVGNGNVIKLIESNSYAPGVVVTLTADAMPGSYFGGWSGDMTGADSVVTVIMTANRSVTATFASVPGGSYTLDVGQTGAGDGVVTRDTYAPYYFAGTVVTLTATPGGISTFSSWSGDAAGAANVITVAMTANKSVTATFDLKTYTLAVGTAGDGAGNVLRTPDQVTYTHGSVVTLEANPADGSYFSGWSGDASGSAYTAPVTMTANRTVTATFTDAPPGHYTLDVNTAGTGGGSVAQDPYSPYYADGTVVTLTATPDSRSDLIGWSGAVTGEANPVTLTMTANKSVTAAFNLKTYTLTVAYAGSGSGAVTKSPDQATYAHGTVVTLTATPGGDSTFGGWNGVCTHASGPCVVTMNADKAVAAIFDLKTYTLAVNTAGSGAGGVTKTPDQPTYTHGSVVMLEANPALGSWFAGWIGDVNGAATSEPITMTANKSVTATFTANPPNHYTLDINQAGNGAGAVTQDPYSPYYASGTVVTLTATAATNSNFGGWSGAVSNGAGLVTVTMDTHQVVTATFNFKTYTLTVAYAGNGGGAVTQSPDQATYVHGTIITLTASPDGDSTFTSWNGACTGANAECAVLMDNDKSVLATFSLKTYTLAVNTTGGGAGSVARSPDQTAYTHGAVITLTAEPLLGSWFAGWSGDANGTLNPTTVVMAANKAVTATFGQLPPNTFTLKINTAGKGAGTVVQEPYSLYYPVNTVVTLTAVSNTTSAFVSWSGDLVSTAGVVTLTMNTYKTVTATFDLGKIYLPLIMRDWGVAH